MIYTALRAPTLSSKRAFIMEHGIPEPVMMTNINRPGDHWIMPSLPELEYPMEVPSTLATCGPIYLSSAQIYDQDRELAEWLKKRPTILVNLGTHVNWDDAMAALSLIHI